MSEYGQSQVRVRYGTDTTKWGTGLRPVGVAHLLVFELLAQTLLPLLQWGHEVVGALAVQSSPLQLQPVQLSVGALLDSCLAEGEEAGLVAGSELLLAHVLTHHARYELEGGRGGREGGREGVRV